MSGMKLNGGQSTYLDFVRGMAAMAVLFGHASMFFLNNSRLYHLEIQKVGVLVFFLLSGFLISYSVFQKHKDPSYGFRDFFIDRFTRIYAAFLPALVFVWLIDMQTAKFPVVLSGERLEGLGVVSIFAENMSIPTWIGNLFMLQDFPLFQVARRLGIPDSPWFFDEYGTGAPFWTICIEWWIYMLFGFIAVWKVKMRRAFRWWHWPVLAFVAIEPFYYFIGGIDSCLTLLWMMGMGAALLFLNMPSMLERFNMQVTQRRWTLACIGAGVFGLISMTGRFFAHKFSLGFYETAELQFGLFLALALFAFLLAAGALNRVWAIVARPVKFVADYSFSLYLTHMSILVYMYLRWPGHSYDPQFFWISIAACNAFAILFWWLFERHYRTLARILKRKYAKPVVVTA